MKSRYDDALLENQRLQDRIDSMEFVRRNYNSSSRPSMSGEVVDIYLHHHQIDLDVLHLFHVLLLLNVKQIHHFHHHINLVNHLYLDEVHVIIQMIVGHQDEIHQQMVHMVTMI